jgi:Holliday junction DNA helicase RuvB
MTFQKFSPRSLREFCGQELIKKRLKILFDKFDRTQKFPSSFFIYGPNGSGKTTLAELIAKKLNRPICWLDDINDPQNLLSQIISGQNLCVFIADNLEDIDSKARIILKRIIKSETLEISVKSEKPLRINLKNLIIIGISGRAGNVPKIIRENFQEIFHFERYKVREIKKILTSAGQKLKINLENEAAWEIARAARKNPQRALGLLEKIINFARVNKKSKIDFGIVQRGLLEYGIDRIGLEKFDRDLLKIIIEKFSGGAVGIENYAAKLGENVWNIEEVHEPYLIEIGFLRRTPRGRIATRQAHEYLGYQYSVGKPIIKIAGQKISRNQKKLF